METYNIKDFKGGWICGNFEPSIIKTEQFEVGFKVHHSGSLWEKHRHNFCDEISFLVRGKMLMQGKEINAGQIFLLKRGEIADPIFLEDCEIFILKTPSIPGDKEIIE